MSNGPARSSRKRFSTRASDYDVSRVMLPPQSIESEQAVLGGLMLVNEAWDVIADMLEERDFYRRDHQLIFRSMQELAEKNQPFDAVTMGEWFEAQGMGEQVGGGAYLIELASTTPSAANITAYAEIVAEKALLRRLIDAGTEITNRAFNPDGLEGFEVVAEAEQKIFAVGQEVRREETKAVTVKEAARQAFDQLQEHYNAGGGIRGLPTGYTEFDEMMSGLNAPDLIILAARPAMGKTTLALNMAEHVALRNKTPVAVFSMEMSSAQLATRLISSMGRVNAKRLRDGHLEDEDWAKVSDAVRKMTEMNMIIDDTPALSPERLRSKARRLKREFPALGLIVVDYLQLMKVPGSSVENRTNEVTDISRSLKALAKELNVPVIALSQLNRGVESRSDKRPVMADLRESGAIEQDADAIVFIYRDDYYNKENSPDQGLAEVIIAKQRMGETGTLKLKFEGHYSRFSNLGPAAPGEFV